MKKGGYSCLLVLELSPQVGLRLRAVLLVPSYSSGCVRPGMDDMYHNVRSLHTKARDKLTGWLVGWSSRHTLVDSSIVSRFLGRPQKVRHVTSINRWIRRRYLVSTQQDVAQKWCNIQLGCAVVAG